MSEYDIIRRIADRGLRTSQRQQNGEMMDLWQHMLDEIKRAAEECAREALAALETDEARFHHPVSDEEEAAIDAAVEDKE